MFHLYNHWMDFDQICYWGFTLKLMKFVCRIYFLSVSVTPLLHGNINQNLLAFLKTAYSKHFSHDVCRPIYHNQFTVETYSPRNLAPICKIVKLYIKMQDIHEVWTHTFGTCVSKVPRVHLLWCYCHRVDDDILSRSKYIQAFLAVWFPYLLQSHLSTPCQHCLYVRLFHKCHFLSSPGGESRWKLNPRS
jgi:hypothetical protein